MKFRVALQLQSMKTIFVHYVIHPMSLFMLLPFQNPFSSDNTAKIDSDTMPNSFRILLGLSPVWHRYVTRQGLPTYDELEKRICKIRCPRSTDTIHCKLFEIIQQESNFM